MLRVFSKGPRNRLWKVTRSALQEVRLGLPTPEYCARHSKKECARRPTAKLLVSCSLMDIICEQMNAANGCRMALCLNWQILVSRLAEATRTRGHKTATRSRPRVERQVGQ